MQIKNDYQLDKILQRIKSLERERERAHAKSTKNWELSYQKIQGKRVERKDCQFNLSGSIAPDIMQWLTVFRFLTYIIWTVDRQHYHEFMTVMKLP